MRRRTKRALELPPARYRPSHAVCLAVRRADMQKLPLGDVEIDDLTVRRLRVIETQDSDD